MASIRDELGSVQEDVTVEAQPQAQSQAAGWSSTGVQQKVIPNPTGTDWSYVISFTFLPSALAIVGLAYLFRTNLDALIIFGVIGGFLFLPLGAFIGSVVGNPVRKARFLSSMNKEKNLGIAAFVSGSNHIKMFIKDLNQDAIWIGEQMWVVNKNRIFKVDEHGEMWESEIDPNNVYSKDGVPIIFFNMHNNLPLDFTDDTNTREKLSPEDVGAITNGYIDSEIAKSRIVNKRINLLLLATAVISVLILLGQSYDIFVHMDQILPTLKSVISGG